MEKNNVESVCLFLQLLKLRVQKMFIKKELKKYTWQQTVKRTLQVHDALQSSLTSLQEAELDQPIPSLPVWQQYMNIFCTMLIIQDKLYNFGNSKVHGQLIVLIYK